VVLRDWRGQDGWMGWTDVLGLTLTRLTPARPAQDRVLASERLVVCGVEETRVARAVGGCMRYGIYIK
jgi:hypothetical protein